MIFIFDALQHSIALPPKQMSLFVILVTVAVGCLLLLFFKSKLPKDQGREFAFNGKLSAGKPRGAGILIVAGFVLCSLLFVPITLESLCYYIFVTVSMLSGFFDDRAKNPWNEYVKGALDLLICLATAFVFIRTNSDKLNIDFIFYTLHVNPYVYLGLATVFLWLMINAVNCSDGIDGFCGSLSVHSLAFLAIVGKSLQMDAAMERMSLILILSLLPYLWLNAEPSKLMMGDAGSRAIGLFMGIAVMESGNILLSIPLCFVLLCDGLLGIVKVSLLRFLKLNPFKNIRTPLHDHFRKNKGWSNTQTTLRFLIFQTVISLVTLIWVRG